MNDPRKLLDAQLSSVNWTQKDRAAVLCAIEKENGRMKKKPALAFVLAVMMVLMTTLAIAVGTTWGVLDFAQRDAFVRENLPKAPVQQEIVQSGGQCREVRFSVTDVVYDGETVCLTLLAEPMTENLLLMDVCLTPDMPIGNLDKSLTGSQTIGEYCVLQGYTDSLGVDASPRVNGIWKSCRIAWHMEKNGGCTTLLTFDNVAAGDVLDVEILCSVWGYDAERESFCDDARCESTWLNCTLKVPER